MPYVLDLPRPIDGTPADALLKAYDDGFEPVIEQGEDGGPALLVGFKKAVKCGGGKPDAHPESRDVVV